MTTSKDSGGETSLKPKVLMFWLSIAVYRMTSKLSGIKQLFFVTFINFVGQEFRQGIKGQFVSVLHCPEPQLEG